MPWTKQHLIPQTKEHLKPKTKEHLIPQTRDHYHQVEFHHNTNNFLFYGYTRKMASTTRKESLFCSSNCLKLLKSKEGLQSEILLLAH